MKKSKLQDDLFLFVGYLLTSAHGLYSEPAGYGPFRLLDASGRLLEVLQRHGLSDRFLDELEAAIEAERFGTSNDEQFEKALNELCLRYAQELKNRSDAGKLLSSDSAEVKT